LKVGFKNTLDQRVRSVYAPAAAEAPQRSPYRYILKTLSSANFDTSSRHELTLSATSAGAQPEPVTQTLLPKSKVQGKLYRH
jgi:hypothetical protein